MANSECRWQCPEQWSEWSEWLAAGLHARSRWRLPVLLMGILFAGGRRTVTTWLRAAGVSDDLPGLLLFPCRSGTQDQFGRHRADAARAADAATAGALAVGDRRFAHQTIWAESRRRRRASQPDAGAGRPTVSVWACLGHDLARPASSPVGPAGVAGASLALRSPEDAGLDPQRASLAAVSPPSSNWRRGWSNGWLRS